MKKINLMLIFILAFSQLSLAQLRKGDILMNLYGRYDEGLTNTGVTVSKLSQKQNMLNSGISTGLAVSKSLVLGVGMEYSHQKNEQVYNAFNYDYFAIMEQTATKSDIIAPMLYAKYYKKVFSPIYICLNFQSSYGFAKTEMKSLALTASLNGSSADAPTSITQQDSKSSGILNLSLKPEVNIFVSSHLGLSMAVGGLSYTSFENNGHEWHFSLNPTQWEYGIFWKFGKR